MLFYQAPTLTGAEFCPDELHFTMDSVKLVVEKAKLTDNSFHFFVVECDTAKDVQKYKVLLDRVSLASHYDSKFLSTVIFIACLCTLQQDEEKMASWSW